MRTACRPALLTLLTLCAVALLAPLPGAAQTRAGADGGTPRTAWGDPDLQGTWSYASLTPLERPAELAQREFFTPEEAADRNEYWNVTRFETRPPPGECRRLQRRLARFRDGQPGPAHVADCRSGRRQAAAARGNRAPPGGGARAAAPAPGRFLAGPDQLGPLHHLPRRAAGFHRLQQHLPDTPGARLRLHPRGGHPRRAHHSARRAPAAGRRHPPVERQLARPLGRRHAGGRDGQLQPRDAAPLPVIAEHACGRALHAHCRRHDRARVHHRGRRRLHAALDRRASDAPAPRLRHLRVRLPRGQLRPAQHAQHPAHARGRSRRRPAAR